MEYLYCFVCRTRKYLFNSFSQTSVSSLTICCFVLIYVKRSFCVMNRYWVHEWEGIQWLITLNGNPPGMDVNNPLLLEGH
ncbi:hypothetical protein GDO86_013353 [Hymenochirus boettgeri]|uniref:Uncharacterized protein n=1 Tax=Hymenochirus boettgeri TaxID=247094 RepID=A0A8T2IWD5_9PIPI|nr:hypothetical protein GDO86_013353 [Hymenochirus boettgeri]